MLSSIEPVYFSFFRKMGTLILKNNAKAKQIRQSYKFPDNMFQFETSSPTSDRVVFR